jgi:hypothetical protein
MAPVGYMPYLPRNKMFFARAINPRIVRFFPHKKINIDQILLSIFNIIIRNFNDYPGSTPPNSRASPEKSQEKKQSIPGLLHAVSRMTKTQQYH